MRPGEGLERNVQVMLRILFMSASFGKTCCTAVGNVVTICVKKDLTKDRGYYNTIAELFERPADRQTNHDSRGLLIVSRIIEFSCGVITLDH